MPLFSELKTLQVTRLKARMNLLALAPLTIVALLLALSPIAASAQNKTILIFAPHPDDEALCCAGVINAARANGDTVKVVVVTNGDAAGTSDGLLREGESVAAMALLGLNESDVIFFGYGDQSLKALYESASPTSVITSAAGQTQTYANRGLGFVDYHMFLQGAHGSYNRATILGDFKAAIQNFQPDDIYTASIIETHPDHASTYAFVAEALIGLQKEGLSKVPRVHEMTIHQPCSNCGSHWPEPAFTPSQPYPLPPELVSKSAYRWNQTENIPVPPSMQDLSQTTNLKSRVIAAYPSQTGGHLDNWLFSFVKKNEFFWIRNFPTNLAPLATVSVSSENTSEGRLGIKAVDQQIIGYPQPFGTAEWATQNQLAGSIRLTWPSSEIVSNIVLYDRLNMEDNVLSGTLTFSDGSTLAVGALPPGGNGALISFSSKTVTWVQFTIDSAEGGSTGLSEIEVFGKSAGSATNHLPQLFEGPAAASDAITDEQTTNVTAAAFDVDEDSLIYTWTTDAGRLSGSGSSVTLHPPAVAAPMIATITLTIDDGRGGRIQSSAFVTVEHGASSPVWISSLNLNPTTVASGSTSTGTVNLNMSAPNGAVLALATGNSSVAKVPATVTVSPGSSTATFAVNAGFASSPTDVAISGSLGAQTRSATLRVTPPAVSLASLKVNPATVGGGNSTTGTITLTDAAPSGGALIALSSGNPSFVGVPAHVTVPAGSSTATFTVTTLAVPSSTTVTLSAGYVGSTATFPLRVAQLIAPNLATLATVSVSSENSADAQTGLKAVDGLVDGSPADYTKEWATRGELRGAWIRLTWNTTVSLSDVVLFDRPNTVDNIVSGTLSFSDGSTVAVGNLPNNGSGATISFAPRYVTWVQLTIDSATGLNIGLAEIAAIGSVAPPLSAVTMNPATVTGGTSGTGTVTLSSPAPAGGAVIALSSDNAAAKVPATVTIAPGASSANFTVTTGSVSASTTATISATFNGTARATTLTVNPVPAPRLTLADILTSLLKSFFRSR